MQQVSVVFGVVFSTFRFSISGFRILCAILCVLSSGLMFAGPGEAGSFSAALGEDGVVRFTGSESFECAVEGHEDVSTAHVFIYSGGPIYSETVHSGSTSVSVDGLEHNISCRMPGDRIYRASFYGGVRKENPYTHEMECRWEGTGINTASVYLPEGRETAIEVLDDIDSVLKDRVKDGKKVHVHYNFPYSTDTCYDPGANVNPCVRSVSISVGSQSIYFKNGLPLSGDIIVPYDFSNKKGWLLIKAKASCGGHGRTTEKLVYIEPEDSCPVKVGKPVSVASGNVYLNETDFTIKGIMPVTFTRYYDSAETAARGFGQGWGHTYDTRVIKFANSVGNTYRVINPGGSDVYYIDNDRDGIYDVEFPKGERSRLIKNIDNTFVREFFDGNKEAFNSYGYMTVIEDRNGNRITLTRGTNNRLTQITDPSGRVINISYSTSSGTKISSITVPDGSPNGRVYSYIYLSSGHLGKVIYPDSPERNYEYIYKAGDGYRLSGIKDENGHYIEKHTYDLQGRAVTSSADGTNEKLTITYDSDTQSTVTDSLGRATQYTVEKNLGQSHATNISGPGCKSCGQGDVSRAYDDNLNVTSTKDANGNVAAMSYDAYGNMLAKTEAYGTAYERTTTYTYNGFGQVLTVTDDDGNPTAYTYDANGNLTSETDAEGNTTTNTYGPQGEKLSTTDPKGHRTSFTYDPYGNLATVTNALSQTITYTYDSTGKRVSMTDVNGNTTTYGYDLRDRLIRETKPDGGVTVYEYDPAGNRTAVIDLNGNRTTYVYDSIDRLIEIRTGEWPDSELTTYTYDTEGNMTTMTIKDSAGNAVTSETYEYDDHNRLTRTTHSNGTYTEQGYDAVGNVLARRDGDGIVTSFAYDALNRLKSVTDTGGGITSYTYDTRNNITSITDAGGNVTIYSYDRLNRLKSIESPDNGVTTYAYDANGNMITKTDANGVTITYAYDALNRQTVIEFPDPAQDINYFYDDPKAGNGRGSLTAMTDPSGETWYDYDKTGRVVRESRLINHYTYVTEYSYDLNGNVLTMTYPSGRGIAYSYNRLNKIASVADNYLSETRTLAEGIVYRPFGDIKSMTYGNGTTATKQYDGAGRTASLLTQNTVGANGGSPLLSLSYSRDNTGNITAITDNLNPSKNKSYMYDGLRRLTLSAGPWGAITYAYDSVGNRTYETTDAGNTSYNYSANKLTSFSGEKGSFFNYDKDGNVISEYQEGGVTPPLLRNYGYNQSQRLTRVSDAGKVLGEYVYNANGQRVRKCTDDGTQCTIYHYDRQGLLIAESSITGDIIAEYIYMNGQLLARTGSGVNSDTDKDGIADVSDNCRGTVNPDQRDSNADEDDDLSLAGIQHYGNICDPDVDNNGLVGLEDYNVWRRYFRQTVPPAPEDIDFNGNGLIGLDDYNIWRKYYGKAPGPGRDSSVEGNKVYYYHNDHLGAPMLMTDAAGNIVWQGDFKPFGEPVSVTGPITNNLRFPGQYFDAETGLHQNWHRDYMPESGRYMEADPILQPMLDSKISSVSCSKTRLKLIWRVPGLISDPQDLYPYVYTKGNPVNLMDPTGLVCGSGWTDKIVPDNYGSFNFTLPCTEHDKCYDQCGKAKLACDALFFRNMMSECRKLTWLPISQLSCMQTAGIYYSAVVTFGLPAYRSGQKSSCCN